MSYKNFFNEINNTDIQTIFELGSRDLKDSVILLNHYPNSNVYAFECNPDCLKVCHDTIKQLPITIKNRLHLIDKAVSLTDGMVTFYPFDLELYDNMGASSMLQIDFSKRLPTDHDYNRPNPQKMIQVSGVRLDTFLNDNNIQSIDLLCIDLQGYELNAIKSLGNLLNNVKYIITECSVTSTYINGATFFDVKTYLEQYNFKYVCSNMFGKDIPNLNMSGFSEFDALFQKN